MLSGGRAKDAGTVLGSIPTAPLATLFWDIIAVIIVIMNCSLVLIVCGSHERGNKKWQWNGETATPSLMRLASAPPATA